MGFDYSAFRMNENKLKVYIGNKQKTKDNLEYAMQSYFVKPAGKFWKRYFNKKVRKGAQHKRGNWWEWS
jgi:ABC-type transporter lipoprotein component MlaA